MVVSDQLLLTSYQIKFDQTNVHMLSIGKSTKKEFSILIDHKLCVKMEKLTLHDSILDIIMKSLECESHDVD